MVTDFRRLGAAGLLWCLGGGLLLAQPPADQPAEPLEAIPPTRVLGQPQPFPSSALNEQTLVTPYRSATAASEVASSVTVVTEEQIQRTGQSVVSEVLRSVPGLDVVQQGGPGRLTSVFMRGANSQQTKVLLDGIPINDPSNATRQFDFANLLTDNIERIEVLRGPQSMVYGSDAIGGVINIITKRGEGPPTARLSAQGGSFGISRESIQISGGGPRGYFSIGGSYFDTSGISAAEIRNGNFEKDGYQNGTISGRFGWTPADALNVDYVFRYIDAETEMDDIAFGFPPVVDNFIRSNKTQSFFQRVQIQSALLDGRLQQKVGFSLTDYDRQDINAPPFFDTSFKGQTRQFDWQGSLLVTPNNTFTAGVDYWQEDGSTSSEAQRSQNNAGVYLQDRLRFGDRVAISGGVRWDDNSGAGPATTYRATARWNIPEMGTVLHSSLGTGFRAPSLAEKFFAFGNPALRPEKSQGWDAGVQQRLLDGNLIFDVTYFDNDFTNLVIFDLDTFTLLNIGRARASGVELTASFNLSERTTATATYTFTDTRDQVTGTRLARRPLHKASLWLSHRFLDDRADANVYLLYVDERLDTPFTGVFLDSYITVNLSGSYRLSEHVELFARVDNLLNEQYQEAFGFGTPDLSGYAGLILHR